MPKLVMTIHKASADQPWIMLNDREFVKANLTQTEIDKVFDPYHQFVISLPGYGGTISHNVDSTTMTITYTFDTVEHAESANEILGPTTSEPIVMANRELITALRDRLGVEYTYTMDVVQ